MTDRRMMALQALQARIKRMPPSLSVVVLLAAIAIPAVVGRAFGDAQTAQHTCAARTVPGAISGSAKKSDPGKQLGVFIFPRSTVGDTYLSTLGQASGAVATPKPTNATDALAQLTQQALASQQLQKNIPALYASMYGIVPSASGAFGCGGLPLGSYSLLAVEQPTPPPATNATSTPVPYDKAARAAAYSSLQANTRVYSYSWAVITPDDLKPKPSPTPAKGATAAPPVYPVVSAHAFQKITLFPARYFAR